jgi:hypothetical protein
MQLPITVNFQKKAFVRVGTSDDTRKGTGAARENGYCWCIHHIDNGSLPQPMPGMGLVKRSAN